jgi:hypothetical protein
MNNVSSLRAGEAYFIISKRYPQGVKMTVERVRTVRSGAAIAFGVREDGIKVSFPAGKLEKNHIQAWRYDLGK